MVVIGDIENSWIAILCNSRAIYSNAYFCFVWIWKPILTKAKLAIIYCNTRRRTSSGDATRQSERWRWFLLTQHGPSHVNIMPDVLDSALARQHPIFRGKMINLFAQHFICNRSECGCVSRVRVAFVDDNKTKRHLQNYKSLFLWLSFFFFHFCARVKKDNIQLFIYMMDRTHKKNVDVVRNTKRIGLLVKIFVFLFIFFVVILSSFILLMQIHVLRWA